MDVLAESLCASEVHQHPLAQPVQTCCPGDGLAIMRSKTSLQGGLVFYRRHRGILPKKKIHLEISKENWTRQLGKGLLVFYRNHLGNLLWPNQVSYRALVCLLTVIHKSSCNNPDLSDYPDRGRFCNLHCYSNRNAVMEGQSPWNKCVIGGWQGNK